MSDKKSVPTGVKVIAVLYYIGAALGVILGLVFLAGAGVMGSFLKQIPVIGALGAGLFAVGAIVLIAFAVLGFFVGKGLWHARPWARIVAIVLAALGVLTALFSMFGGNIGSNIVNFIIELVIGGYLLLAKSCK